MMIKFSEATAIALHAMIYLAGRKDKVVSVGEIAGAFSISSNHLSKLLQRLAKAGYLISFKGPKGGFQIAPRKVGATFMEIYETIEGRQCPRTCLFASRRKKCKNCIMGGIIPRVNKELADYMKTHKLTDFNI